MVPFLILICILSASLFNNNPLSSAINFRGIGSSFIVAPGATLDVQNQLTCNGGTIEFQNTSPVSSTFTGNPTGIYFTKAYFKNANHLHYLNCELSPTATESIILNNGDFFTTSGLQTINLSISVANDSSATISGSPIFTYATTLGNAASILNLNLQSTLNQSITGSGKVNLLSDLTIGRNVQLPSLLTQNNFKLNITGGTISSALTSTTGGTIEINNYTSMTATWTLGTGADVYIINGNGNVLDLSGSGGIVFNGTSLYLNDINIRGVSTANPIKGTGTIYLSKVSISLAANFVRNDGSFYFWGDLCRIITNGYTFNMDGVGKSLTVDRNILFFEQLDGSENYPFIYTTSATQSLLNGASIKSTLGVTYGVIVNLTNYTQTFDLLLTNSSPLQIYNPTPASPRTVAYNGNNLFIHHPNANGTYMNLDPNITLNLTNIVLKDFHHNAISYGGSGSTLAKINFGSGVRIELGSNLTLASTDTSWAFNGNAEIDGNGATLQVDRSQGITITGANTLTLKNMVLYLTAIDAVKALTDTATIALENCTVILRTPGFQLSTGNMTISKFVKITGGTLTTSPQTTFELTTKGTLTIGENSELFIDRNVKLRYNINPVNDTTLFASKRHILMSYTGSALTLNGCTLESTATGIGLDSGTLRVYDKVTMNTSTSTGAEGEFGSNLLVNLSAGAILDVTGPLKYIP